MVIDVELPEAFRQHLGREPGSVQVSVREAVVVSIVVA